MPEKRKPDQPKQGGESAGSTKHVSLSSRPEQFEKRQADLWRLIYLILVVAVAAFIWTSRPTPRSFVYRLEAAAFGLLALVLLLCVYDLRRRREESELRGPGR